MAEKKGVDKLGRRQFLAGTAAAATFTVIAPSRVRGAEANSTIRLGLIGCGGRGNWIADRFVQNGGYRFVACADYFQDHVDKFGEKYKIDPAHRHTTLSAYKRLVAEKDVDAVVIESPPYCHPEHAEAAVDAGKHVFLAKPIAVDVPGCRSILASGQKARANKLVYLIDFQTRANEHYRAAAKRVLKGDIGKLVCAEAQYPWQGGKFPGPKTPEDRLRRWYCFKELSGDFIIEQSIHALDVATWFLNADPISAVGVGGSKGLRMYGNIMDYFALLYKFPDEVPLSFYCVQAIPKAPNEISCRVFGSEGTITSDYYKGVSVSGVRASSGGECPHLFDEGARVNVKEFHQFVMKGDHSNPTVEPSVRSNLTAILGRTAGYKGGLVTWKELMDANEKMEFDRTGLKS